MQLYTILFNCFPGATALKSSFTEDQSFQTAICFSTMASG